MTQGWIVVREEKHIDDRFWVCLHLEDALRIAADVVKYWLSEYEIAETAVERQCYGEEIFHCESEDGFRVYVIPQTILAAGENDASVSGVA